ncbi:archease [Candidatus Micrarchaeota archaeon]|jgi:SHS2 domain-containing protein|nr:archease [Candidatus Micrarchaeota archaeon]
MEKYEFLEHTADILFKAYGSSFEEALSNAALALFETVGFSKTHTHKIEIEVQAKNREELVVRFLSEILTEMDINEMTFKKIKILELDENIVKANIYGDSTRPKTSVKAVTYHLLEVKNPKFDKWAIQVLLDV